MIKIKTITGFILAVMALTALNLNAEKPVQVYILSGQSNMVGIGQVGPMGATRFNSSVSAEPDAERGTILSVYQGEYDPAVDYEKAPALETHQLDLGYWPHKSIVPEVEGPHFSIARGYIRIDRRGEYSFKTTGNDVHAANYEKNLVALIKALRKDFEAPDAPFVVAVGCGNQGREGNGLVVAEAQLAVDGRSGKYPDFNDNVMTVETRDFWPDPEQSPKPQGFHYHQNARTYMQIGEVMGAAMVELQKMQ